MNRLWAKKMTITGITWTTWTSCTTWSTRAQNYYYGWVDGWLKITLIIRLSQPSLAGVGAGAEIGKTSTIKGFYAAKNSKKNHPMVPPFHHFQGENKNRSSLARTISTSRRSFFAILTTFERRFAIKNFSLLKIAILKMGWL